jgi:hypothetical protein
MSNADLQNVAFRESELLEAERYEDVLGKMNQNQSHFQHHHDPKIARKAAQ